MLPTTRCTVTSVDVSTHEPQANNQVLQDLLAKRSVFLQELSELNIAIEVFCRMYS